MSVSKCHIDMDSVTYVAISTGYGARINVSLDNIVRELRETFGLSDIRCEFSYDRAAVEQVYMPCEHRSSAHTATILAREFPEVSDYVCFSARGISAIAGDIIQIMSEWMPQICVRDDPVFMNYYHSADEKIDCLMYCYHSNA